MTPAYPACGTLRRLYFFAFAAFSAMIFSDAGYALLLGLPFAGDVCGGAWAALQMVAACAT